jgi:hypothetical protein
VPPRPSGRSWSTAWRPRYDPPDLEGWNLAGFRDFVAELKRRRVIRALVGWGIFGFAVLQIYEPVMHGLRLPEWTLSVVVLMLAAGFPAIMLLAWIFDLGAGGIARTAPSPNETASLARRVRVGLLLVGLGVLAAVPGVAWYAWQARTQPAAAASHAPSAGPSDGVAEEILTALSKVMCRRWRFEVRGSDCIGTACGAT